MREITKEQLKEILEKHRLWLNSGRGERANLSDADLSYAVGNLIHLKSIFIERYPITYTADVMQIGCERHAIADWWEFDDERIGRMDNGALEWWKKWLPFIQQAIELSPAEPTGYEEKQEDAA